MTNFEILVLIGLAGIIGVLFGIKRVLNNIERRLFGIRYHFPFIESADTWRLMSMKENNEESPGELDEWYTSWKGGKKPLLLFELLEMKTFLNSIENNLKRMNEERPNKP